MNTFESALIEKTIEFAKKKMRHLHSSHGWDHVQRVINISKKITLNEVEADPFIVKVAAILHDIAREKENKSNGKICHASIGSEEAYNFLINEGLDNTRANKIKKCILTHRFRNSETPASVEAKIIYEELQNLN